MKTTRTESAPMAGSKEETPKLNIMGAEGVLDYVCVCETKGKRKRPVHSAQIRVNHGIEGDAHAGYWHRQISLLDIEDVETMRRSGMSIGPGDFGENLGARGIALSHLGLGSRLRVGESAELIISQIGKVCHTPCHIYARTGDCIMPRRGLFARVTAGGRIRPGDPVTVVQQIDRSVFQAVILTIRDDCSRGPAEDTTGPAVANLLDEDTAVHVYRRKTLPDQEDVIQQSLCHYADGHGIDLVITVGRTRFSPCDVIPKATRAVVENLARGFDGAMQAASFPETPHAKISRGIPGICGQTLIVNLPGSQKAAKENLSIILPILPHALAKLRGDVTGCTPDFGGADLTQPHKQPGTERALSRSMGMSK